MIRPRKAQYLFDILNCDFPTCLCVCVHVCVRVYVRKRVCVCACERDTSRAKDREKVCVYMCVSVLTARMVRWKAMIECGGHKLNSSRTRGYCCSMHHHVSHHYVLRVAVCCSVLQCVAVSCGELQCVAALSCFASLCAESCSVLQCVAVCCSEL